MTEQSIESDAQFPRNSMAGIDSQFDPHAVPDAFLEWNRHKQRQGAVLREVIARLLREDPGMLAREVRSRISPAAIGRLMVPRKRAIQLHMQQIRRSISP